MASPILESAYLVKPLPNESKRGYRVEIDEFLEDNELTNLFLVALSNLQKDSLRPVKSADGKSIPNWLNYYAAAAIHGGPVEAWNGVPQKPDPSDGRKYGYCHHGRPTFPIWHRPYIAFYEGIIHQEMVKVADQYVEENDKAIYTAAAARFRLPFWDIVMPRNKLVRGKDADTVWGIPQIMAAKKVFVKLPKPTGNTRGGFDEIDNPLYSFKFPERQQREEALQTFKRPVLDMTKILNDEGMRPWSDVRTTRVPVKGDKDNTGDKYVDLAIRRQAAAQAQSILDLLDPGYAAPSMHWDRRKERWFVDEGKDAKTLKINELREWKFFADHRNHHFPGQDGRNYLNLSLESFHDRIHMLLGTGGGMFRDNPVNDNEPGGIYAAGHLANSEIAAFDPMFWLHHNNIERILCLYQAMYPTKYLSAQEDPTLAPFFHENGKGGYWKATDSWIKEYWHSGFAVPGAERPQANSEAIKQSLLEYLAQTYKYWALNFTSPNPRAMPANWPRNLEGSWALKGAKAQPLSRATVNVSAITAKTAQLVHRKVEFAVPEEVSMSAMSTAPARKFEDDPIGTESVLKVANLVTNSLPAGALETVQGKEDDVGFQFTWDAHVKVRKHAFDGPFSVHVFVGEVEDQEPNLFMTKKNEAGFIGIFTRTYTGVDACENCARQREEDVSVSDVIPLTSFLYAFLDSIERETPLIPSATIKTIRNLTPEEVVPFLKENIKFRMIDAAARRLEGEQAAGLEIRVAHRTYIPPTEQFLLGQYGDYVPHLEITNDKPGGSGYPDGLAGGAGGA